MSTIHSYEEIIKVLKNKKYTIRECSCEHQSTFDNSNNENVYQLILEKDNDKNDEIWNFLKHTVSEIFDKYKYTSVSEIPDDIWNKFMFSKTTNFLEKKLNDCPPIINKCEFVKITILGIMSLYRNDDDYPDNLYIFKGPEKNNFSGPYKCNLMPALKESDDIIVSPGCYHDLFTKNNETNIGLIQSKGVALVKPHIENNEIIKYDLSEQTFMCVRIPTSKKDNIITTGATFDKDVEQHFLNDLKYDESDFIDYILLEDKDFF